MNTARLLQERVKANPTLRVVICGDRMVDRWHVGRAYDSQDGCQKFLVEEVIERPGGAANAAACLKRWSTQVILHGQVTGIPIKNRYVDETGKILFRVDSEQTRTVGVPSIDIIESIRRANVVLLSDYDKGFLSNNFIRVVVTECLARGIPCVADCKRPPDVYDGCIPKGNYDWARQWRHQNRGVITHGALCPTVDGRSADPYAHNHLPHVPCLNHVGAGDAFAAHLALALACEFPLKEAARIAHSAGRVYVQRRYNQPPRPEEVAADMECKTLADLATCEGPEVTEKMI